VLGTLGLIRSDLEQIRIHFGGRARSAPLSILAAVLYRIGHRLWAAGWGDLGHAMRVLSTVLTGAEIDVRARIGPGLCVQHPVGVTVGFQVVAGKNLHLFGNALIGWGRLAGIGGEPRIGDDVTVYAKASILGPIAIGDGAAIGSHALVMTDVPGGVAVHGPRAEAPDPAAKTSAASAEHEVDATP
jgi:serine O-acetyltransferase